MGYYLVVGIGPGDERDEVKLVYGVINFGVWQR